MIFSRGERISPKTLDNRFRFWYYLYMTKQEVNRKYRNLHEFNYRGYLIRKVDDGMWEGRLPDKSVSVIAETRPRIEMKIDLLVRR